MSDLNHNLLFPDVLGAITNGTRIGTQALQFAVGVSPRMTYIGQPVEVVLILQNMINQRLEVKIALGLPTTTPDGKPMTLTTPRKQVGLMMNAGEVGALRLPVVPIQPSHPSRAVTIRVAVRHRLNVEDEANAGAVQFVRALLGGSPPSELAVSPFQLQVLSDVDYTEHGWDQSSENVSVAFDVVAAGIASRRDELKPRYTTLWTPDQMPAERERVRAQLDEARIIAADLTTQIPSVFPMIFRAVDEMYAARGLPLRAGESFAISKMIAYAFLDHSDTDRNFRLEDLRWFQTLCSVLAYDEAAGRKPATDLILRHLFYAAIHDAVILAYGAIRPHLRIELGDKAERIDQANQLLAWLVGGVIPDMAFIYMPLALGGLAVMSSFEAPNENPWVMLDDVRAAYRARIRTTEVHNQPIFDMIDKMVAHAEAVLKDGDS